MPGAITPTESRRDLRLVREDEHVSLLLRGETVLRLTIGEWFRLISSPEYPKPEKFVPRVA